MNSDKCSSTARPVTVMETRHILGLSGGKDSAALAIYLKQQGRAKRIEYFFCDTGLNFRRSTSTSTVSRTTSTSRLPG